ncbi:Tip elongation aberrant protein 1 [Ceratocystis lukuohia]|uniref:Tip elongation aberrant protein 1 n=1 Tax=Ceratocystis lukuohia TaxID=2019550 RepID=A0ABR4MS71_9PEZI
MAFLFKSKKGHDRNLASRDGTTGSSGSKGSFSRSTPTGSLNSLADDTPTASPDQSTPTASRRGPNAIDSHNATPTPPPSQQHPSQPASQQVQSPQQGPGQSPVQQAQPPQQQQIAQQQPSSTDLPFRNVGPQASNPNASLYPWSQRRLTYTSSHPPPFPRYGAAVNSVGSKEGDVYIMGGLINSTTVKGDLWMIEAGGNLSCYPLATTAEGPGPRVGHASLLVGNAFIVYGGDTKIDENDVLDETLYLLNTSTRQWSRALPPTPRPSGRYGHTLNILGSKIYIFGGQVEGFFMNDLCAFDLNQLQSPTNKWEVLISNTELSSTPSTMPSPRTNHTVVTFNDKLYLFGGTNGYEWFNDVWCYDPTTNKWSQLDCIGYIPVSREGHAAALVDDVMYIFGGRTEEGTDLGDLAAFRITTKRWYTFQNMGPSPSPRSGHSMTSVGKSIVIVGGEPSSTTNPINDLGLVYVLDTTKIRYPNDNQSQRGPAARRTSNDTALNQGPGQRAIKDGTVGPSPDGRRPGPQMAGYQHGPNGRPPSRPANAPPGGPGPGPNGPMNGGPGRPNGNPNNVGNIGRARGASSDRDFAGQSPVSRENSSKDGEVSVNGRRTPQSRSGSKAEQRTSEGPRTRSAQGRMGRNQGSVDSTHANDQNMNVAAAGAAGAMAAAAAVANPTAPATSAPSANGPLPTTAQADTASPSDANKNAVPANLPSRQPSNSVNRRSSMRNSQTVTLLKELDSARNRNAWYASELELARKAGYSPTSHLGGPMLEGRGAESFDDEDKPLIEALLAMKSELAAVQSSVDKQSILASKQIAEAEKQRDAAIQEAVYAKAKLAGLTGSAANTPQLEDRDDSDRNDDISRRLASSLNIQKDMILQINSLKADLEVERKARKLADDTAAASQRRMVELEAYKQMTSPEVERLKAEVHSLQRESRDQTVLYTETLAAMQLLKVEKDELSNKYNDGVSTSKDTSETISSLKAAVAASAETKAHMEKLYTEERALREEAESKLSKLSSDLEARTSEVASLSQRMRDAEAMAEKYAQEAEAHKKAIVSGLEKMESQDSPRALQSESEKLVVITAQLATATGLVKKYQEEANAAADKLRGAEERIAGLEAYQEQTSREGVGIRRQLQSTLKETQSLQAMIADLKNQLAAQQLETNAITIQHTTLKDILSERGISPASGGKSKNGSRAVSPEQQARLKELESQLTEANSAHEKTKQSLNSQLQESVAHYRDKLTQLEQDYNSAVHYVRGTEKMLQKLKEEQTAYKNENKRLKADLDNFEKKLSSATAASSKANDWGKERAAFEGRVEKLQSDMRANIVELEGKLATVTNQLSEAKTERSAAISSLEELNLKMMSTKNDLETLQEENQLLERRAMDAEHKVSMLLDQVESSVDNYRRRSRQVTSFSGPPATETNGSAAISPVTPVITTETTTTTTEPTNDADRESFYGAPGGGIGNRNSAALDSLASELETLRSQWEATNKNYRLSNAFEFETQLSTKKPDDVASLGISESLADWRKRLDMEEKQNGTKEK